VHCDPGATGLLEEQALVPVLRRNSGVLNENALLAKVRAVVPALVTVRFAIACGIAMILSFAVAAHIEFV
jgi:hypothetical protein